MVRRDLLDHQAVTKHLAAEQLRVYHDNWKS
jgi:hypothetical protein